MLINSTILEDLFSEFLKLAKIETHEESKSFTSSKYFLEQEHYKYAIYDEARESLGSKFWKPDDIGTGKIQKKVSSAIKTTVVDNYKVMDNNLVDWRKKDNFSKLPRSRSLENTLFNLYKSKVKDSILFEQLLQEGLSYQFVAYLFFIKEKNRFLPISQERFDEVFEALGLSDFKTSGNGSWENYSEFLDIIKQVRNFLKTADKNVTLLDAHSFLWIISQHITDIIERKTSVTSKISNSKEGLPTDSKNDVPENEEISIISEVEKFDIDRIYKRSELHDTYGGNRQGGISKCANYPLIFIFTGVSGEQHGYEDGWDENNYFNFTGEGQSGDMKFIKGNLAIRDHIKNGSVIHLFEFNSKAMWKYVDELELIDYYYFDTKDRGGNLRKGIKFKFKSSTEKSTNSSGLERKAENYNKPDKTVRKGLVSSRVGQGWYRRALLERWQYKCAVTGCELVEILIASHILAWKDADDTERLDVDNGLLLSPIYDALFDKHLISFQNDGSILISKRLHEDLSKKIGISGNEKIANLTKGNVTYLEKHREKFNEANK